MDKTDLVNEELAKLADRILNEELTERIAGREETITADEPARAAYYATLRTEVYDEEPAAVLNYTENIPTDWREYLTEDTEKVEAMAKASFEEELYNYLATYKDRGHLGDLEEGDEP